jgi:hypothetical protein
MGTADRVAVERLGGMAGFGGPVSHLRSRGEMQISRLSPADRSAVDALFAKPPAPGASMPDAFRYRLTRHGGGGTLVIEVAEEHVPSALRACVTDELA